MSLELDRLEAKLVRGGRGGYCFEQNVLFWRVLHAIGFKVSGLGGRVRLNWPDDFITPRGHMALRIELGEGPYIVDVGFGGFTLTAPVRFEVGVEQRTPHEPVRLMTSGASYAIQVKVAAEWKTLYVFDLAETYMADYEMFNWYYATHPRSPFVTGVILARPEPGRRYALRNTRYSVHELDGRTETRYLVSVSALRRVIEEDFRLPLPESPLVDEKLARLIETNPPPSTR